MIKTITVLPGVTLRCFRDTRFKQGCLSLQFIRPMNREEAALNALIPAVLLRGCTGAPDLRSITLRLDDLYGACVNALVRRVGDYHAIGLSCQFISDRYTLDGDRVLGPMIAFLGELLLQPVLEKGVLRNSYVQSEKKNLIATIEAQRNDKRAYAAAQLLKKMCRQDTFGIPRLGEPDQVAAITAESAYRHYLKILSESPVELFFVGDAEPEEVAGLVKPLFEKLPRKVISLQPQMAFQSAGGGEFTETMEVAQGKLAMGFVTPITVRSKDFATMQVCNTLLGGGMTSKLFMNVREKMSLCYDISSGYHGSKGILTVHAGIDCAMKQTVCDQIYTQLDAIRREDFSEQELEAAKQALISSLRGVHDSPGSIESYYATAALSGLTMTPAQYLQAVESVSAGQVAQAAKSLLPDTVYFLKGVD